MSEPNPKNVTRAEAKAAADALYRFWDCGRRARGSFDRLVRTNPLAVSYGNKEAALAAAGAEHGLNPDLMRKAVNVAGAYSAADIREICRLVRDRPARFSYSHLARLMGVPEKPARDGLIRHAIRLQWSVGELNTALKARRGRRDRVGRRPGVLRGARRLLVALEAQCLRFVRWVGEARPAYRGNFRMPSGRPQSPWSPYSSSSPGGWWGWNLTTGGDELRLVRKDRYECSTAGCPRSGPGSWGQTNGRGRSHRPPIAASPRPGVGDQLVVLVHRLQV